MRRSTSFTLTSRRARKSSAADAGSQLSRRERIGVANRRSEMAYKIAIIVGSLREGSLNRKVARSICAIRGDNLDCEMIEIGNLPLYNQDSDSNPPSEYAEFRRKIAAADGVLFVSPEYNR